jgi:predicted ribosomally synthesized peptide with nif11-like leader
MSGPELNRFLGRVAANSDLQTRLRVADPRQACALAREQGFDVTVADLIRYKSRSTSWTLRDEELEAVAAWQSADQPFWWQHIWPMTAVDSQAPEGDRHD